MPYQNIIIFSFCILEKKPLQLMLHQRLLVMNTETESTYHLLQQKHINLGVFPRVYYTSITSEKFVNNNL